MNIGTANYVITRQIQNSNIPFKYQVNLPWNTPVGLPKAFQRKTNWKYWIKYIKPIWCPQQTWTSARVMRHDVLDKLLVRQSATSQIAKFMGPTWRPTWALSVPDGPHVGPMNLAIRDHIEVQWYMYASLNWIIVGSGNDLLSQMTTDQHCFW